MEKDQDVQEAAGDGLQVEAEVIHRDMPHGMVIDEEGTLQRVYQSERWVPSDRRSSVTYPTPQELIQPFLDILAQSPRISEMGLQLRVETTNPVSVQDPLSGVMHTAYGRVLVEARLGEINDADHYKAIGFVYALDTKKPEVQVYSGYLAAACINLAIFRRDHYAKADLLTGGDAQIHAMAKAFADSIGEHEVAFVRNVRRLQETIWTEAEINERIGRLYRHVLTANSFGSSTLNYALKLLADPNSRYGIEAGGTTTAWNFFSALTQFVTDKADPASRAEKTLQITEQIAPELLPA